ncbi:MAG: MEDS domain-containing protein [Minicystis sp.]
MQNHRGIQSESAGRPGIVRHGAQFYASDDCLAQSVGAYLGEGIRRGEGAIVIATARHWRAFRRKLDADGVPLDDATRAGRIVFLDAAQALGWIVIDGVPSARAFHNVVSASFNMIADRAPRTPVRAYGEMVDLLWNEGRLVHALALERLWNGFLDRKPVPLLCAYQLNGAAGDHRDADLEAICAAHGHTTMPEPG